MTTRNITFLPRNDSLSGWTALAARQHESRRLDEDTTADWLVIGAGFAGLSAARRLLANQAGGRIVVLEARLVAEGASGRNSGFMIDVPHNIADSRYSVGSAAALVHEMSLNRFAIQFAADVAGEYGMGADTFELAGKVNAAASARGERINRGFAKALGDQGEPFEFLDGKQMREIVGSDYFGSGVYTPGTAIIQPAAYIQSFAAGLSGKVSIFEQSPVVKLERIGHDWVATSPHGSVRAPKVIMAVNGYLRYFGYFQHEFIPIYTYASMTAPFDDRDLPAGTAGKPKWAILPADPMGATLRKITTPDGARILTRTRFRFEPEFSMSSHKLESAVRQQRKAFDVRFPALRGMPMEYTWGGALCLSINHVAAFGEIDEGMYAACCCNGMGTVKSTLSGILAADLATGQRSGRLDDYIRESKPKRLPPAWLLGPMVNTTAKWRELRAGKEA